MSPDSSTTSTVSLGSPQSDATQRSGSIVSPGARRAGSSVTISAVGSCGHGPSVVVGSLRDALSAPANDAVAVTWYVRPALSPSSVCSWWVASSGNETVTVWSGATM